MHRAGDLLGSVRTKRCTERARASPGRSQHRRWYGATVTGGPRARYRARRCLAAGSVPAHDPAPDGSGRSSRTSLSQVTPRPRCGVIGRGSGAVLVQSGGPHENRRSGAWLSLRRTRRPSVAELQHSTRRAHASGGRGLISVATMCDRVRHAAAPSRSLRRRRDRRQGVYS